MTDHDANGSPTITVPLEHAEYAELFAVAAELGVDPVDVAARAITGYLDGVRDARRLGFDE